MTLATDRRPNASACFASWWPVHHHSVD